MWDVGVGVENDGSTVDCGGEQSRCSVVAERIRVVEVVSETVFSVLQGSFQ